MDLQLKDKIALVSGSTAGIGRAIAEGLAAEGASVIVNGRTQEAVQRAVSEISAAKGGKVLGFAGDLSDAAVAEKLAATHPQVDIVVNNLGIFAVQPFEDIPDAEWQRFFNVNVLSGVRLSRLYLAYMRQRNWGRIIFISSESGMHIPAEMVHYGMTKAAQIAVARGLAESLAGTGITVNSVLPGPTRSRGVGDFVADWAAKSGKTAAQVEAEFFQTARPTSLLKRFTTPEEVAAMVTYVASPRSAATTGAALRADGGTVKSGVLAISVGTMDFSPHVEILPAPQRQLWRELTSIPSEFVLYGGTALALHLGHRTSIDFDFFGANSFGESNLEARIGFLAGARIIQRDQNTLSAIVDRDGPVKVSFFGVPNLPRLASPRVAAENKLQVASLLDIAGTKASVIQVRAEAKDYIDIDALINLGGVSLATALAAGQRLYGAAFNPEITLKALSYFGDGNLAELPGDLRLRLITAVREVDLDRLPEIL